MGCDTDKHLGDFCCSSAHIFAHNSCTFDFSDKKWTCKKYQVPEFVKDQLAFGANGSHSASLRVLNSNPEITNPLFCKINSTIICACYMWSHVPLIMLHNMSCSCPLL